MFTLGETQKRSRNSYTFSLTSALDGVDGQRHAPTVLPSEKDLARIVQEAGWVQLKRDGTQ
jgi:hypothetical protein